MSTRRSHHREMKYVSLAVLATASGAIAAVDFHDWRQVAAFVGANIVSACVASKAYHDLSSSISTKQS